MKISVIGASAGVGLETVLRALSRQHEVTTLSRSAVPLPETQTVTFIRGSATDRSDLASAVLGADAVIVALGTSKNMKATTLFSDSAALLAEIQRESGTAAPFIFVTGFGAGDSRSYVSGFVRFFLRYFLKDVYADKTRMEEIATGSGMNWVVVRPGRLLEGELTEEYRIERSLFRGIKISGINRANLADFLVKQAESPTELRRCVAISSR